MATKRQGKAQVTPQTPGKPAKPKRRAAKPPAPVALGVQLGRTFDARPDRLDLRDFQYRPPLKSLPAQVPSAAEVGRYLPTYISAGLVLDQGEEGACTGFGLASVINYLLWVRESDTKGKIAMRSVSPVMLYALARRYDEWPGEGYVGSSCRGALKGWHRHGVASVDFWPYVTKGKVKLLPPRPRWQEDAVTRPLGVYYRVDHTSVVDLQAAIFDIGAVYVSAQVHNGWSLSRSRIPNNPPRSHAELPVIQLANKEKVTGGHAFALVGYNEDGFVVQNSWGSEWGNHGFAVLTYEDWVRHGTDAWVVALGVPQRTSKERLVGVRWPAPKALAADVPVTRPKAPNNPVDDPWPIDREYAYKPYEPWSTAAAYEHTLITANDGKLAVTDLEHEFSARPEAFVNDLVVKRPIDWLGNGAELRLLLYAHGGLNSQEESIERIRVLGPLFLANGVYPIFLTWKTGVVETIRNILSDHLKSDALAAEQAYQGFGDWLAEKWDRGVEAASRVLLRGLWTEMRENAQRSAQPTHGIHLLASQLEVLRKQLGQRKLKLHIAGHSAGAILLGHLLAVVARQQSAGQGLRVAGATLLAPACTVRFAVEHYLQLGSAVLDSKDLHLHVLSDSNEKADFLVGKQGVHLYGKSLLYLVSRALDDERKAALLGMERAHQARYLEDSDQWCPTDFGALSSWNKDFRGKLEVVTDRSVLVTSDGKQVQAQHGSFDNNITVVSSLIERSAERVLVSPIESLDY